MSPSKPSTANKNAKKRKGLSLNKKTLKDLSAPGKGPVGGRAAKKCTWDASGC